MKGKQLSGSLMRAIPRLISAYALHDTFIKDETYELETDPNRGYLLRRQ